ncbi:ARYLACETAMIDE DEACETYLASE [Salix purpurea]|uniref:ARYLACETAMIDE DEACETYLASE n=1 Tax=Salix purpurea TaxID=77065 RepID=A0A9Q0P069_SALPP|nr:ARYLACETAMIDE DEACETYLASE [Salix purpurea]
MRTPGLHFSGWLPMLRKTVEARHGLRITLTLGECSWQEIAVGANVAHHFALKLKDCELGQQIKIQAIAMIFPYFWGKDPIGVEVTDEARKSMVDNWWLLVCPSEKGCDDPLINPFTDGSPSLESLACKKLLVIVAENDILRDRGRLYYEKLVKSGWQGTAKIMEISGEDHVFHIHNPDCENAKTMFKGLASFINQT